MKKENRFAAATAAAVALLGAGFLLGRWAELPGSGGKKSAGAERAPLAAPGPARGMVTFRTGEAFRLRSGEWAVLEAGDLVEPGDTVKVVDNGAVDLQFGTLAAARLLWNSSAAFEAVDSSEGGELTVRLISGTGLFTVRPGAGRVGVMTPAGALTVTGTEFLVRSSGGTVLAAVGEGSVTGPEGIQVPAGRQVRFGGGSPVYEELTPSVREELEELRRVRRVDLPDTGLPRMARVVVETSPGDALILRDGQVLGRGSSALVVPFGETVRFDVAKKGYRTRSLEIPVVSLEADKKYLVRLELDPSPEFPDDGAEGLPAVKGGTGALEREIENRESQYRTLSGGAGELERKGGLSRREAEAALGRVAELESRTAALAAALAAERERMRQVLERLRDDE